MTNIEQARHFAEISHAGQTRKGIGAEPYTVHLAEVAADVARFGGTESAVMAAWLHDTVEDCGVSADEIAQRFGAEVAGFVAELTDDKSLPKPMRKEKQIVNAPGKTPEAALVKLCDKMSNVRAVGANPPLHWPVDRMMAYVDWAETVVGALPPLPEAAREAFATALRDTRAALALRL